MPVMTVSIKVSVDNSILIVFDNTIATKHIPIFVVIWPFPDKREVT